MIFTSQNEVLAIRPLGECIPRQLQVLHPLLQIAGIALGVNLQLLVCFYTCSLFCEIVGNVQHAAPYNSPVPCFWDLVLGTKVQGYCLGLHAARSDPSIPSLIRMRCLHYLYIALNVFIRN